jgi:hypothetical protein
MNRRQPVPERDIGPWAFIIVGSIVLLAVLIALIYLNAQGVAAQPLALGENVTLHQAWGVL